MTTKSVYNQPFYNPNLDISKYSEISRKVDKLFAHVDQCTRNNLVLYIVNLLQTENNIVAISRRNDSFLSNSPKWHSRTYAIRAQEVLSDENYIVLEKGYKKKDYETGFSTRIKAKKKVLDSFHLISKQIYIETANIPDLIIREGERENRKQHEYKCKKTANNKVAVRRLHPSFKKLGPSDRSLARLVFDLNTNYFSKIDLTFDRAVLSDKSRKMISNVYLTCIKTRKGCGRLYQRNGISYLQIKKSERKNILINGKKTSEVDYSGAHFCLLYAKKNISLKDNDPYGPVVKDLIGKTDIQLRDIVKKIGLILLNSRNLDSARKAFNSNYVLEKKELEDTFGLNFNGVVTSIKKIHKPIKDSFHNDVAIKIMKLESKILMDVLQKLNKKGILGIPFYDSMIVQQGNEKTVAKIMVNEYRTNTGKSININIK